MGRLGIRARRVAPKRRREARGSARAPWLLHLSRQAGPRAVRGQSEELACPGPQLLPGGHLGHPGVHPRPAAPDRRPRHDRHRLREGGGDPREQPDQRASTAAQREAPGRQGVPEPPPRSGSALAPPRADAETQAGRGPLLRPLPLGDGGAPHPPPGGEALPAADLHRSRLRQPPPPLHPVSNQALPRALRVRRGSGAVRGAGPRRGSLPERSPRRAHPRARGAHEAGEPGSEFRGRRHLPGPARRGAQGARAAARRGRQRRGSGRARALSGGGPRRARRRVRAPGAGHRGREPVSRPHGDPRRRDRRDVPPGSLRGGGRRSEPHPRRDPGAGLARRRGRCGRVAHGAARGLDGEEAGPLPAPLSPARQPQAPLGDGPGARSPRVR